MSVIAGDFSKILVITNEIEIRQNFEQILSQSYELLFASSEDIGLELIRSDCPDLVLSLIHI